MTIILLIAAIIAFATGHWGYGLILTLAMFVVATKTAKQPPSKPTPRPAESPRVASGAWRVADPPGVDTDEAYGMTDTQLDVAFMTCAATVKGRPGGGLDSSGFANERIMAGQQGEISVAKALAHYGVLDDPGVHVWFSMRNPGDESGDTDIDIAIAKGDRLWLVDAKKYGLEREHQWLCPSPDTSGPHWVLPVGEPGKTGPYDNIPLGRKTYTATSNMHWVYDTITRSLPGVHVTAVVALTRTIHGTYGTFMETMWPGDIPARNLDRWITGNLLPALRAETRPASMRIVSYVDPLVKH